MALLLVRKKGKEGSILMQKHSNLKKFLLRCWIQLASVLQWIEEHPLVDQIILEIIKLVTRIFKRQ